MRYFFILIATGIQLALPAQNKEDFPLREKDQVYEDTGPALDEFNTVDSPHITGEEIQDTGLRSAYEMATLMSTQVEYRGGNDLYIRNLPAQIYVDGVKIRGNIGLPQKAIGEIRISGASR